MTIIDNDVVAVIVRHGRQLVALGGGCALLAWVYMASPGPARFAAVVGAAALFLAAVRVRVTPASSPGEAPAEDVCDPEILALIHRRLAEQDERVCQRLDALIAELRRVG